VLYVGILGLYIWNDGDLLLLPGLHLDPLVLLLPAVVIGWLGLPRRAAAAADWLPYREGAAYLYPVLVLLAAAALGYAFATANDPLLLAARRFTALTLFVGGAAYLLYVLVNFGPLIRQRLRVYRVVYEPRRLPLFAVYVLLLGGVGAVEFRNNFAMLYQVQAGYYNNLGDLTRLQSEQEPSRDALALLAERYYAESDILDEHNHKASLGRAALYRFRLQRQNEINILRRALSRRPSEKISLRLAALYNEPNDFFDRLAVLREGLKNAPTSPRLNNDLAHLYSRSTLSDSVNWYLNRAEAADPGSAVVRTNRLALLLQNAQFTDAAKLVQQAKPTDDAAWQNNVLLLAQQSPRTTVTLPALPAPDPAANLTVAEFARLYHASLRQVQQADTSYLPALTQLVQRPSNADYFEQLTFLRGLTQHYGGQPVPARTTLAPLLAGNTPSAAYYQNLQALWLLEQHAYGSAAATFADAGRNGYPEALLHRAYALALNQLPDSAQAVAATVLAAPDTTLQRPARQLQQVLTLSYPQTYAAAPAAAQAQYLALSGYALPAAEMLPAAERLPEGRLRETALLAQLPRALQASQLAAAEQVVARFGPALTQQTPEASAWNVVRGNLLLRQQNLTGLRQLVASGHFAVLHQPYRLTYQAALADKAGQTKQATQLYRRLLQEAPFLEPGVLAAAEFYSRQKDYLGAYAALQAALAYNPESVPLLKAYALAAVPTGLSEYSIVSLDKLRSLLSPAEYATFRRLYDARLAAQAAAAAPWN
jgi:predicted Zn-dependent protease